MSECIKTGWYKVGKALKNQDSVTPLINTHIHMSGHNV